MSLLRHLRRPMTSSPPARPWSRGLSQTRDSHADFAPIRKKAPATPIASTIATHLSASKVVLYMKGLPSSPQCGFSWRTVQVLNATGVEYTAHNVLADERLREGIKRHSAWPTIPQLYVDAEFVGGCDIVEGLYRSGELGDMLEKCGANMQGSKEGGE